MKYTGLIFIFILLWSDCISAQVPDEGQYEIYVNTPSVTSSGSAKNGGGRAEIYAGGKILQKGSWGEFKKGNVLTMGAPNSMKFFAYNKPLSIIFYGYRHGTDSQGSWRYEKRSEINISGFYPYYDNTVMAAYEGYYDAATTIRIKPDVISLFYCDENGNSPANKNDRFLPSDDNITLKATTGFPKEVYPQLYYEAFSKLTSVNTKGNITMGNSYKTFKGTDFLSEEQFEYLLKQQATVQFHVNYTDANECKTIILFPILSAPHIVSASSTMPRCKGESNGSIILTFDRALKEGERLYFTQKNGENNEVRKKIEIDTGTKQSVIEDLPAGEYDIGLMGAYTLANGKDTVNTFTDGAGHFRKITIHDRTPIDLSELTPDSVHCYGGKDGRIELAVSGGTSSYTAILSKSGIDIDTTQKFTGTYTFDNLPAATYTVRIKDSNGCVNDLAGQPLERTVTVDQPANHVELFNIDSCEATGYGRSTGWVSVSVKGGIGKDYTFTWTHAGTNDILPAQSGTTDSRLEHLPTGYYHARVEDGNYNKAYPHTEINTLGCYNTVTIFIDQPPKLITEIKEKDIVICHGDSTGTLLARTTGGRPFTPAKDGREKPYDYVWSKEEGGKYKDFEVNDSTLKDLPAGAYRVRVTDRNNIDTISLTFHLAEPDSMSAHTTALRQLQCDGDSTGIASVIVTGGTAPYTYEWTTDSGDRTETAENLPRGIYTVFVRDSRYLMEPSRKRCTAEAHVNIQSPNGIVVQAVTVSPVCSGYADGHIELSVRGGVAPYRYLWDDGSAEKDRCNLAGGEYTVTVTDANGCFVIERYTLSVPAPVTVTLGEDITLCTGQHVSIKNLSTDVRRYAYSWTDVSGNLLSNAAQIDISAAGTYRLTAISSEGCSGEDAITVKQSDMTLHADFVVSSHAAQDREIHAVNIMRTEFDSIRWILPESVHVSGITDDRASLTFYHTGEYAIGLQAFSGACRDTLYKTVRVVPASEIAEDNNDEPFLKRFVVYPNPGNGNFSALVELREQADYRLMLYDNNGVLLEVKDIRRSHGEETAFIHSELMSGIYILRFMSKEHVSIIKVIVR